MAHGGDNNVLKHLNSNKHKLAVSSACSSKVLTQFFKNTSSPTSKNLEVAAAEGVWTYHNVQENQSFRANDCSSKIIQTCL